MLVSVPCSPQSGRGGAIVMYSSTTINADNDKQIAAENGCHNGAAPIGAPAAGTLPKRVIPMATGTTRMAHQSWQQFMD